MDSQQLKNAVLRLAALLLCLTLLSAWAASGMYARYSTGITGSASARVAKFRISDTLASGESTLSISGMAPGSTQSYSFQVTGDSEVAVKYTLKVTNETGNLPLTYTATYPGANDYGTIAPNDKTPKDIQLTVYWPADKDSPEYAGKTDLLTVRLTAEQID